MTVADLVNKPLVESYPVLSLDQRIAVRRLLIELSLPNIFADLEAGRTSPVAKALQSGELGRFHIDPSGMDEVMKELVQRSRALKLNTIREIAVACFRRDFQVAAETKTAGHSDWRTYEMAAQSTQELIQTHFPELNRELTEIAHHDMVIHSEAVATNQPEQTRKNKLPRPR